MFCSVLCSLFTRNVGSIFVATYLWLPMLRNNKNVGTFLDGLLIKGLSAFDSGADWYVLPKIVGSFMATLVYF